MFKKAVAFNVSHMICSASFFYCHSASAFSLFPTEEKDLIVLQCLLYVCNECLLLSITLQIKVEILSVVFLCFLLSLFIFYFEKVVMAVVQSCI